MKSKESLSLQDVSNKLRFHELLQRTENREHRTDYNHIIPRPFQRELCLRKAFLIGKKHVLKLITINLIKFHLEH